LNLKEKAEFANSLYEKLVKTYPNVDKPKVVFFVGVLLYQNVPAARVCQLYKDIFQSGTFVQEMEKNIFRCTFDCLKDKLPVKEVFRILGKCLNVDEPLPCFAQEVGEHLFECVSKCFNKNDNVESKPSCEEKVKKVRLYFQGLTEREEKKEFVKKLYSGLTTKYPTVERTKVGAFIKKLLLSNDEDSSVCSLFKETFLKQEDTKVVKNEEECGEKVNKVRDHFKKLSLI